MFFFYASSWLAEHAADWLIVQGGYYMAAIAMRSFPIIPFRRDHQVPSTTLPPSSIPALPSLHSLFLTALSSCPPLHTLTCTHSRVNRAPPALTEQMGAAEDSRLVFSRSPHFAHTHTHLPQRSLLLSLIFSVQASFKPQQTSSTLSAFVFTNNSKFEVSMESLYTLHT